MTRCTRRSCGKEYDPAQNSAESCTFHPGAPVFHEGLKSWSCCDDVNKPVLDFEEFMQIPGCSVGAHTDEAIKQDTPKPSNSANLKMTGTESGKETYSSVPTATQDRTIANVALSKPLPAPEEEEDDVTAPVAPGTKCQHKGCNYGFVNDAVSRNEGSDEAVCRYHPMPPLFREGSKGYLCCKRRVLEFDEFLKIEGCKQGRHLFVPKNKTVPAEEFTTCRIDHYQTPTEVHVSVFAKKADTERSTVEIKQDTVLVDLYLPGSKRFKHTLNLFGPINPSTSAYKYYGTKVEIVLKKQDTRSWTVLEKTSRDLGGISLTFGVGGRTGTVGGKEVILDETNSIKLQG